MINQHRREDPPFEGDDDQRALSDSEVHQLRGLLERASRNGQIGLGCDIGNGSGPAVDLDKDHVRILFSRDEVSGDDAHIALMTTRERLGSLFNFVWPEIKSHGEETAQMIFRPRP